MDKRKKRKEKKLNKEKLHPLMLITLSAVFCVVCVVVALTVIQSYRLENGLVDVCAAQQDAYVQLVLDQINLKDNRDNQEIIENILGTLDASSNKYWTFSDDQTMLFVKDVLETNKYKGFTAETYFVSDSATKFFDGLRTNKVTHSVIWIDDSQYIASGVVFRYQGEDYKLCLLTNKMVLLENNQLLRARTEVGVIIFGVTVLFSVTALCYALRLRKMQLEKDEHLDTMKEMNTHIEKLNEQISKWDIFDTRNNVWKKEALVRFAEKIEARNARPVTLVLLHAESKSYMKRLIETAHYVLDHNNLRFMLGEDLLLLLYIQCDMDAVTYSLRPLTEKYGSVVSITELDEDAEESLVSHCLRLLGEEEEVYD